DIGRQLDAASVGLEAPNPNRAALVYGDALGIVGAEILAPVAPSFFICDPEPAGRIVGDRGIGFISRSGGHDGLRSPAAAGCRGDRVDIGSRVSRNLNRPAGLAAFHRGTEDIEVAVVVLRPEDPRFAGAVDGDGRPEQICASRRDGDRLIPLPAAITPDENLI